MNHLEQFQKIPISPEEVVHELFTIKKMRPKKTKNVLMLHKSMGPWRER